MSVRHRIVQHGKQNPDAPGIPFEPYGRARRGGMEIKNPGGFLRKKLPKLYKWLCELFRNERGIDSHIALRDMTEKGEPANISFSLWGHEYEYVISATVPTGKRKTRTVSVFQKGKRVGTRKKSYIDQGYIGAGVLCRAPYVGEQHRRARDLFDGPFNEQTWRTVLRDVLVHSLIPLHDWARKRRGDFGERPRPRTSEPKTKLQAELRKKRRRPKPRPRGR